MIGKKLKVLLTGRITIIQFLGSKNICGVSKTFRKLR
jgi:hypothetical protein